MASHSPPNFANHPGLRKTQSGKWGAVIRHPITKRSVWLGSYTTPEEAAEAYTSKKIEYQSLSKHKGASSLPKNRSDHKKLKGVRPTNSGKWGASIRHPVSKVSLWLGSYDTPEEAAEAYTSKKIEYQSLPKHKSASSLPKNRSDHKKFKGVRPTNSGKWGASIRHPVSKTSLWLGSYDTPEEAAEAYTSKKIEYQSLSKHKSASSMLKNRSDHKKFKGVRLTNSGKWGASIRHPVSETSLWLGSYDTPEEAADAYNKKKLELDLLRTPPRNETGDGLKRERGEFGSMVSAREKHRRLNDEVGNEGRVSGVVDGYGRLVGEFSRLDDELWLTSSLDEDGDTGSQV